MAFWVKAEEVPLYIQEIIFTKLQAIHEPSTYLLRGTHGGDVSTYKSAVTAYNKLIKWAGNVGADTTLLRDDFATNMKVTQCRFKVEITDPASKVIDELIQEFRNGLYRPPQDRDLWIRRREKIII